MVLKYCNQGPLNIKALPNLKKLILNIKEKCSQKYTILPKLYIVILNIKYVKSNLNVFQDLESVKTRSYWVAILE